MTNDTDNDTLVVLDVLDAVELAEICRYLRDWIDGAPSGVHASLTRFAGPGAPALVLKELDRLAGTVADAVPFTAFTASSATGALLSREALQLAELLCELAMHHWPAARAESDVLEDDCRRWALRLARTPGLIS